MRIPASFSSGFDSSANGGKALRLRNNILSLCGENDKAGSGGASTISLISGGGSLYPLPSAKFSASYEMIYVCVTEEREKPAQSIIISPQPIMI